MDRRLKTILMSYLLLAAVVLFSACKADDGTPTIETEPPGDTQVTEESTPTSTPLQPTPTPVVMAVLINGEGIPLYEYEAEKIRYQKALGRDLLPEDEQFVLDNLIYEVILAQGAVANGFSADESVVEERMQGLIDELGGENSFNEWMIEFGYDQTSFRKSLSRSIQAAWMRDQLTASLPENMEQVHVSQIIVFDRQEADQILSRLQAGADFEAVAYEYNPATRGDLGWFPRGYLYELEVESAAFELEPGQFSDVIESSIGYHILFMIERDPERKLLVDAKQKLQAQLLAEWLDDRLASSDIQIIEN